MKIQSFKCEEFLTGGKGGTGTGEGARGRQSQAVIE